MNDTYMIQERLQDLIVSKSKAPWLRQTQPSLDMLRHDCHCEDLFE